MARRAPAPTPSSGLQGLRLRIAAPVWDKLKGFHLAEGKHHESLSYVWARCEVVDGEHIVLAPPDAPLFCFADDCLLRQTWGQVTLRPDVLNGMLAQFANAGLYNCLINVHDHWFAARGEFSAVDDADDLRFDTYLRERFEPMLARRPDIGPSRPIFNLSVVIGQETSSARLVDKRQAGLPFLLADHIGLLDRHLRAEPVALPNASDEPDPDPMLDRQTAFISPDAQSALAKWRIALVGCGGLGTVVAESLLRAGARDLTLIDHDRIEASNLNRWQGGTPADVGKTKARVLARRLARMAPDARIEYLCRGLDHPSAAAAVARSDVVIGLLDNDAARWQLSHVAIHYMVSYFDAGVVINPPPMVDFQGRYFAVLPGVTACTECKPNLTLMDRNAVIEAWAHPTTVTARRVAGYALGAPEMSTPSAYALNQRLGGLVVQEMMNHLNAWRPMATVVRESWRTGSFQRCDTDNYRERPSADCPVCSLRIGRGSAIPMPRQGSRSGRLDLPADPFQEEEVD